MFVTPESKRPGVLVAVVSGGRPRLKERPTAKYFDSLAQYGLKPVWVVSEKDAETYERDDHEMIVYPYDWAFEYALNHWTDVQLPPTEAPVLGGFPGREWACLEAERRGCWSVMQLDDNIVEIGVARGGRASNEYCRANGGLSMFVDLLSAVALSTNARMVGAQLKSVTDRAVIARKGFPYSMFVERVGEGREHWHGPFEDDIIHAFQYGGRPDGVTSAVMPVLRYMKCSKVKGGLRTIYDHSRSAQLQRMFPEAAKISIHKSRSNGRGGPRVFHSMTKDAIKNPLTVHDRDLFIQVKKRVEQIYTDWYQLELKYAKEKARRRTAKVAKKVGI
jgi:hypothetical protein